jgi:Predicted nucleic acid-binding protein, contains PIN domain
MFLVDTSALVRIQRKQVDPGWDELGDRGLLSVCEPVLAETLVIANAKDYVRVEEWIRRQYPWVAVPDNIWDMVAAVRRELAPHSAHQGVSVADLLVAATAIRLKLEVLHEDADFETIGRFVPELRQRRISVGPD